MSRPLEKTTFTYGDYRNWPAEERWELIDGVPYNMSSAPSRRHQKILMNISTEFSVYLKGKTCDVYQAPFDVRLPNSNETDDEITTVVQPDLVVICDPKKLDDKGCIGSPDLVIEVISPSTMQKDLKEKFYLYERMKIQYYWLVYPEENIVTIFTLTDEGKYGRPDIYAGKDKIDIGLFQDFTIDLADVFELKNGNNDQD
ncbi:Uma2 family endonuclease [Scopulibacillus darangshiensis]|uniref:Uma2 family endonuclease n=1 Tax=Scopulibacillus darangshiensis TaxID=442528 RepID=A0A4R2P6R3_9BACL|nr:Uma2 family endonuclease [Scopulibacillus darangshiensis]TCP30589.1 Uma2 family endonuclease [Scopulibacillus darangshiensis]